MEGLRREIREEFGMSINVGDPFAAFTYTNRIKGSHSVEVVYFAIFTDALENIIIHPEDHSEYQWVSQSGLEAIGPMSEEELENVKKGFTLLLGKTLSFG